MATLKDHQAAMVDLLANGSGIPASASRLAHAMHDLIGIVMLQSAAHENAADIRALFGEDDATTPGLNDKAISRRVKELENTIRQLKANNAKLKKDNEWLKGRMSARDDMPEQAGCRNHDAQIWCSECMEAHEPPRC